MQIQVNTDSNVSGREEQADRIATDSNVSGREEQADRIAASIRSGGDEDSPAAASTDDDVDAEQRIEPDPPEG